MAYKRVDDDEVIEGFSYLNKKGKIETVSVDNGVGAVCITVVGGEGDSQDKAWVWADDIPNLIKALQAAYDDHKKGSNG